MAAFCTKTCLSFWKVLKLPLGHLRATPVLFWVPNAGKFTNLAVSLIGPPANCIFDISKETKFKYCDYLISLASSLISQLIFIKLPVSAEIKITWNLYIVFCVFSYFYYCHTGLVQSRIEVLVEVLDGGAKNKQNYIQFFYFSSKTMCWWLWLINAHPECTQFNHFGKKINSLLIHSPYLTVG